MAKKPVKKYAAGGSVPAGSGGGQSAFGRAGGASAAPGRPSFASGGGQSAFGRAGGASAAPGKPSFAGGPAVAMRRGGAVPGKKKK